MQRNDLNWQYRVHHHGRERVLNEHDFPLVIGGEISGAIIVPGLEPTEQVALLGISNGLPMVSIVSTKMDVRLNEKSIQGVHWLQHGDNLSLGPVTVRLEIAEKNITYVIEGADIAAPRMYPYATNSHLSRPSDTSFLSPAPVSRSSLTYRHWLIPYLIGFSLTILVVLVWFVFTARQVYIRIEPEAETESVRGGLFAPRIGPYYLLRPGDYQLDATKTCYLDLNQTFTVQNTKNQTIAFQMEKQPGLVTIHAHQEGQSTVAITGAKVLVDGRELGVTPFENISVAAGQHELLVQSEAYLPLKMPIEIEGCNKAQFFQAALIPAWSDVTILSEPPGAAVYIDGEPKGPTPQTLKLLAGTHQLELRLEKYQHWKEALEIKPDQPVDIGPVKLVLAKGVLTLRTSPKGVGVTVGSKYWGVTPLEISLRPEVTHTIRLTKAGFQQAVRRVKLEAAEQKRLTVKMKPALGVVTFNVSPEDAQLFVDGKSRGRIQALSKKRLQLNATRHRIEIKKKGYKDFSTDIVPRPGFPQEVKVQLVSLHKPAKKNPSIAQAPNGYPMILIHPKAFTMGSSRREQGRRSNETLRKVLLKRPFYIGIREVTNQEFRKFLAAHNSGSIGRLSLSRAKQPVVNISWNQAAQYCNWLSKWESLPEVYHMVNENMVPLDPVGPGYRLPTEAEWEYCAKYNHGKTALKYSWGAKFPPPDKVGNFADVSAKGLANSHLKNYNDGYAVTAPVASFKFNALGLHDMGGNVAEWTHAYYTIYSYQSDKLYVDPTGPKDGNHHVIRGGSWKQASISKLRTAYLDYGNDQRLDVGFRVCRYARVAKRSSP